MIQNQYDVTVCGAGVAGVAAALAAARRGMKTLLIEKTTQPGGLATGGLVLVYLALCDGKGNQMISGISEELLKVSNQYGPLDPNPHWQAGNGRYITRFSPASFVLAMDELLENAGVEIWLDTVLVKAEKQNDRLTSITVSNKSGLVDIDSKLFIDATGDADILYLSGHTCNYSENSMVLWTVEYNENAPKGGNDLNAHLHTAIHADPLENVYTREPLSGKMVTDFILESRRRYRNLLKKEYAEQTATRKTHFPVTLQTVPPIRKGRCINGLFTMTAESLFQTVEDPIGVIGDWRTEKKQWQIPYRALLPADTTGVLAAGRCISAIGDAWEATRVIPVAALTGEVAGTAAALSLRHNCLPHELPYEILREELLNVNGFKLEFD
ncbi:MAG: FAD-dependent oxidoreductase [Lentisphaeria bacterium]|nr:FAD-dependent oxidoreductase [Lentisphaeria bacterium]